MVLDVSAERAWAAAMDPRLLDHVAWPLQTFRYVDPPTRPATWRDGRYDVRLRLFGVLPLGAQRITMRILAIGPDRYAFRDEGGGRLAARWDHLVTIERLSPAHCRYADEVDVRAGALTPLVWAFAHLFFRHRQRRWRGLVESGFAPLAEPTAERTPRPGGSDAR